ncbi:penicillin acylase family protein [Ferruginibacter albus]|uniref:penicillin acylase family protein n=1 Tax=Ferruginibacter albus TaxID=2875540 RepID=UPI001CC35C8A|nr:penicillin acylase family protein [Ferruginibacter albus]UAY51033.1 penicillin acylase family protein [Ferruginibacter albus]
MRVLPFILSLLVTVGLIVTLDTKFVLPAPLGALLSPQHGIWQNAEDVDADFSANLKFPQLKGKVQVYLDDRLVPHVFAEQENDVYFVQGYLHAKFRLWQMELQTYKAAGRLCEFFGEKAINIDREFRRLGMVYAAENSLKEMEADTVIKAECDAYTAGVNAYIDNLSESQLPLEYKLLGYYPEKWNNLKTALFLKYMSYDLAGHDDDFEMTNTKSFFSDSDFVKLFPLTQDSLDPIIPKGTVYPRPKIIPIAPSTVDSAYFNNKDLVAVDEEKPDKDNGSNNWAVSGRKTKNGAPILCNDPHLGLNLPSVWFEMQISTPEFNAYGATFPGAPGVIIGFNDNCAFGFTNGGRDVRDYYEITFKDDTRKEYLFNGEWKQTEFRIEHIKIKDKRDYLDTVAYTVFGPVMYDKSFTGGRSSGKKQYAVRWKAHDPSDELKIFNLLNRAKNYTDYTNAVTNLHTPGQNVVFACKDGDIAMRTQGEFPAKWKGQGDFIMPGTDSSYMWQGMIPQDEVPFQYIPASDSISRGFVSSANQKPTDSAYHYYLGRDYPLYRGYLINRLLSKMHNITPQDMMSLQNNNYNVFAEMAIPVFLKNINTTGFNEDELKYYKLLNEWNLNDDVAEKGATVFDVLWKQFTKVVFDDEYAKAPKVVMRPFESTLLEEILKDTSYKFYDNITTPKKETLADDITAAFKLASAELVNLEIADQLEWAKYKDTHISHLTKLEPFSDMHLPVGGGTYCINATKADHGPSWRMVLSLTAKTEAYGVYPGGQSGNPGSRFYDNFVNEWVSGKYYPLWLMTKDETKDKRIKWVMNFSK